ncbi:MAG TPA: glutathione S-transferase N-terminal domain-containing protein [Caulobacteraceae bacterium]|jgi:GST-like protein|nr:glutathione S-transferase N-terminal domain-containing protein [Caulobacteraceae bacterium]
MITLYTWTTPNGRKASIMLEEVGLAYEVKPVNIGKDEQFSEAFLKVGPNNKIPAIVDHDAPGGPLSVFESGAILVYLAEKTGKLLPASGPARYKTLEWTFWQVGGLGPMLGQLGFFVMRSKDKPPEAIERFTTEAARLFGVMEKRLTEVPYLAGDDYSIADIACYSWTLAASTLLKRAAPEAFGHHPGIERWLKTVGERPAVIRGSAIPAA